MKKRRFAGRTTAVIISACLFAECLAYMNPAEVQAGDVQDVQTEESQTDGVFPGGGQEPADEEAGGTVGSRHLRPNQRIVVMRSECRRSETHRGQQ